ncbi:cell wall hydrolase [Paenibacillus gallinarum]|uniref:Cell wall hydrolase n=1 Tax=Paenibacillus gallinarum TaxID=2762232 RepID=A0ABR8STQ2_9BACL|nr:cell wall hydrolase [Paenibacillus gallinarum]MBD7966479.1 cell wall hydrolase [Paenibacillus gallinarum]
MNTNRETRWVAPLMYVLLVFILGASLITKAVEVYGESTTQGSTESGTPMNQIAVNQNSRMYSDRDGVAMLTSVTDLTGLNTVTTAQLTRESGHSSSEDHVLIKTAALSAETNAQNEKEAERKALEAKKEAQRKQREEQKAIALAKEKEKQTTPPKTLYFTKTELLTQEEKDKATWNYDVSDKELRMLQKIVMAEAEGEPYEGKVAVANVVLNRLRSANYPDTIKGVIYQKYQFSPVANGRMDRVTPNEDTIRAVNEALNGRKEVPDETLYFLSITLADDLTVHHSQIKVKRIGNHTFYK